MAALEARMPKWNPYSGVDKSSRQGKNRFPDPVTRSHTNAEDARSMPDLATISFT
jgi:hypothetical protein